MRRVLIVHTWGIGDWLSVTPVITLLKGTWPDVHIEVILGTLALGICSFLMPAVFYCIFAEQFFRNYFENFSSFYSYPIYSCVDRPE